MEGVVEVRMADLAFRPQEIRVPAGTTVRWVNRDPVGHTSVSGEGGWESPLIGPGETWSRTFSEPGRYEYTCTPHPSMSGVIIVTGERERP